MLALLAQLQLKQVDWVGTSMGGLIGMGVCTAAGSVGAQVRRLVINDVGPTIEIAALRRIGAYLGQPLRFDTPEQAANLRARSELMRQITAIVKESNWTQTEAAQRCGVTQPRMNDLLRGRVSRFSLDALVNIATAMGREVHFELQTA
jgi:predicted XRE-type DNA-binding protein